MSKKAEVKKVAATKNAKKPAAQTSGSKKVITVKKAIAATTTTTKKEASEENNSGAPSGLFPNSTVIEVKPKMSEEELRVQNAALVFQRIWRSLCAKRELARLRLEKKALDDKITKLEQEAFVQMVKMEQEREEKKRMKQLKERQLKAKHETRRKKFLEAAYDGNLNEIKHLIDDLERELDSLEDKVEPARRKQIVHSLIECKDSNNNSALSEASAGGSSEVVKFLLVNNSDPNSRGAFGRTPLWRAAFAGHLNCVQLLLENGADPRLYTSDGQRALDAASKDQVIDTLAQWNIQLTERMLQQIDKTRREFKQEQIQSLEARKKRACDEFNKVKTQFELVKNEMFKCNSELQRLNDEYLLKEEMYGPLIEKKEGEKAELNVKCDSLREQVVKARIAYRELLSEICKEKKKLKKSKNGLDTAENDEEVSSGNEDDDNEDEKNEFDEEKFLKINIKEIDDMVLRDLGDSIKNSMDKWPLIIDQNEQASTFLRYRDTNYVNCLDTQIMRADKFRLAVLGAIRYGKPLVIDLMQYDQELVEALKTVCEQIDKDLFKELCDKSLVKNERFMRLVKPDVDGKEYEMQSFNETRMRNFKILFLTSNVYPSDELLRITLPIKIVSASKKSDDDFGF